VALDGIRFVGLARHDFTVVGIDHRKAGSLNSQVQLFLTHGATSTQ
jgi:hypothetical protein